MDKKMVRGFFEQLDYGSAPESDAKAKEWLEANGRKFGHFINGKWVSPCGREYLSVIDPSNGRVLAEVAEGNYYDVLLAMDAAAKAFPVWSGLSGHERAKFLYAIARGIAKNARLFAVLESMNNGKTIRETRDIDIPLVIRHFYYHAGWAEIHRDEYPQLEPGGVIGQIIPWNFPLLMLAWKIAPAIAVGNTVVLKPAEFTPLTALLFSEMLEKEIGLPAGVINIVTGDGKTGAEIVKHKTPWKIAFTGSTEVGRLIRKETAGSGKHLTMELGGKSPFIVFQDADLDSAVEGVVDAIWFNQGQVCCAGSRLLVQESVYEDFIARLKVRASKLRGGKPLDKAMDIGAVNSAAQFEKITRLVQLGKDEGAQVWQPAEWSCPTDGYFFPPTIFINVSPADTIAKEEIFGPVLVCMSFRTPAEAIQLANNTRYGLAASVWTEDVNKALTAARKIKAGTIWINSTNLFDAAAGFGGYRESGYGREGGREGILEVLKERPQEFKLPFELKLESSSGAEEVDPEIDRTFRFLIGGKLVRPDGGIGASLYSPQGNLVGVIGDASRKDVRNAVEAARSAADSWQESPAHLRAQILYFMAENLRNDGDRFVGQISRQTARPLLSSWKEVDLTVERLFWWAAMADKFEGTVQPVPGRMSVVGDKEPVGVIGMRPADEYPLLGVVSVLAPALAMGNTTVLVAGKYALSALDFISIIQTSDVPVGVVNILSAASPDARTKELAEHEDVDAVWFFGNKEGSRDVEAASVSNMKRTWVLDGGAFDWVGPQGRGHRFLREATQVKNIWIPYGV